MSNELALQKLNEVREIVSEDSDVAELVDTLATLLVLKQDVTNPMLGAKVTFYEKPEGEWVEISFEQFREMLPGGHILPSDPEEAWEMRTGDNGIDYRKQCPWWLSWRRHDGDNHKPTPDGEIRHVVKRYYGYGEKQKIERDEVPDPLDEDNPLEEDVSHARQMEESAAPGSQWHGEWMVYEKDFREYRFTPYREVTEFVPRRAIVIESHIAEQPSGTEFWDPNRGEYTTPDDYPMGTVNVVLPDESDAEFGVDYVYDTRVETSVTPVDDEIGSHQYTPGWDEVS